MRTLTGAVVGSFVFFWLAPGMVAGVGPYLVSGWRVGPPLLGFSSGRILGGVVAVAGLVSLVECFGRFAIKGLGTPAPIAPTERLVVSGLYRHVRNPIYVAVVALILGQALLLGSVALVGYSVVTWLLFHAFVMAYEEPTLRRQFGSSYDDYSANVPRWWPRMTPWRDASSALRRKDD